MPTEESRNRPLKVGVQLPEIERVAPWSDLATTRSGSATT
jgi:hypothetical protein